MGKKKDGTPDEALVKIVYFDEESTSDLLDIDAGGKETSTADASTERSREALADADTRLTAKFGWMSFFGASAEVGAGVKASAAGRSILNKTLSNTILTDYLRKANSLPGIERMRGYRLSAVKESAAHVKMFTPYMAMMKIDDLPLNIAGMDDVLIAAKGYYELVATDDVGAKRILRFNIRAFRNSYGLVDLARMDLVIHGVRVGRAREASLTMKEEMSLGSPAQYPSPRQLLSDEVVEDIALLDVYDVLLAGVAHVG